MDPQRRLGSGLGLGARGLGARVRGDGLGWRHARGELKGLRDGEGEEVGGSAHRAACVDDECGAQDRGSNHPEEARDHREGHVLHLVRGEGFGLLGLGIGLGLGSGSGSG